MIFLKKKKNNGLQTIDTYSNFQSTIDNIKMNVLDFLINKKKEGKTVIAYGAAAKGNTLLNYCGIKSDLIRAVFDAAEAKLKVNFCLAVTYPYLIQKKLKPIIQIM